MMDRRSAPSAARWILVVLPGLLLGCGRAGAPDAGGDLPADEAPAVAFRNAASGVGYVGDAACASCHEDAYRGYQAHGMARSFYRLTAANRVEAPLDEPLLHADSGFAYAVRVAPDGWYQEEVVRAPDGRVLHRLRRRMDYVVGSGHAARTYLSEGNGRLFELPLTWYTQRRRWDFSPGYEVKNGRFDRLIPDRCMACHNSYPEAVPFVEGKYRAVPEGIGCERCHGPGALHVEERLADPDPAGEIDDTIVNPAHLPFGRRLDVCQQCHLSATVSILREGRSAFSFRPSEALSDHLALFAAHRTDASAEEIDVISHADRMRRSACYTGTLRAARPLECVTCHNPHEGFRDRGAAYFNRTCLGCHDAGGLPAKVAAQARADHAPEANCFGCHMPKARAGDAPHSSFTDHWIRVVEGSPVPAPTAEPFTPELLQPYFARDRGNRDGQRYLGMALIVYGRQRNDPGLMATGAATVEQALGSDTTHGEAHFLLGAAYLQGGRPDRAVAPLERAVRLDPGVPERLDALAQAYAAVRRDTAVVGRLYRRALGLQPALSGVRVNYGHFLQAQGRVAEAAGAYRAALAEQPWLDAAAFGLGTALVELGRMDEAERAFREALRLSPGYADVLGNMLLVRTGSLPAAPSAGQRGAGGGPGAEFVAEAVAFVPVEDALVALAQAGDEIRIEPMPLEDALATGRAALADVARFTNVPPDATVRIFTHSGLLVRTLAQRDASGFLAWDLRDDAGFLLASGEYLAYVQARGEAGRVRWTKVRRFALVRQRARR